MNCANHPEQKAVAFCRTCGKPLCEMCQRTEGGTILCEEHAPSLSAPGPSPWSAAANPYPANAGVSPGLAFVLGLIPGVGAIYNAQYAKGVIHAVIFGLLLIGLDHGSNLEPLLAVLTGVFFFYMAFEAYHTALKRQRGEPVDELSSLVRVQRRYGREFPAGPITLIVLGVIFLLNTLDIVRLRDVARFWPVFLIVLGAYLLYLRVTERPEVEATIPAGEMSRE